MMAMLSIMIKLMAQSRPTGQLIVHPFGYPPKVPSCESLFGTSSRSVRGQFFALSLSHCISLPLALLSKSLGIICSCAFEPASTTTRTKLLYYSSLKVSPFGRLASKQQATTTTTTTLTMTTNSLGESPKRAAK